ncbi:MAG: class I SAM-dependent methyltransferase [Pseudomonadota bacterium]
MYQPNTTHDEQARQDFVSAFRSHLARAVQPATARIYEQQLKPAFVERHGREPESIEEVKSIMDPDPGYRLWSALQRRSQEMMWESIAAPALRQREELVANFRAVPGSAGGSLELDPELEIPAYHSTVDIHLQPGGYHSDTCPDDVTAGVLYETSLPIYIGGALGPDSDRLGHMLIDTAKQEIPDLNPQRILDMGCAVGNSTLPWAESFPEAEVFAIDVAAPCLRYGHLRAEEKGQRVHFQQRNAEATRFPDQHFDLIVSHIMLHETSSPAIDNIMAECRRLLKPGGYMLHMEIPRGLGPFDQYMSTWETYNNNEYFARRITHIDLPSRAVAGGFSPERVKLTANDGGFSKAQRNYTERPLAWPILLGQA